MRGFILMIFMLMCTAAGFAMKPEASQPAFHPAKVKHSSALSKLLSKFPSEEESSLNKDDAEHPTLVRQMLKKSVISSIQLFNRIENDSNESGELIPYPLDALCSTDFICRLLYPKHFFR